MKKIKLAKVIAIGVACLAVVGILDNIYTGQQNQILAQARSIEELQEKHKEETEKVDILTQENVELTTNLESARQRNGELIERNRELGAGIERNRADIEYIESIEETIETPISSVGGTKIMVKVTGYCPCELCCGIWASLNPGITASGTVARYGTIAAPPSLPFGTQMMIEGYGDQVFTVEDTGSAVIYDNGVYVIDMWMPTHEQAYAVGNSIVEATIIN